MLLCDNMRNKKCNNMLKLELSQFCPNISYTTGDNLHEILKAMESMKSMYTIFLII